MYSQLAVDAYSVDALLADLASRDPATGEATAPPPAVQPLDLVRLQGESAAWRASRASLRHWERVLREIPARRFNDAAEPRQPRYWQLGYNSRAAHLAARIVADRHRTDSGAVLLAAFAVALAEVTGINPVVTEVLISNRFRPGLADVISPLAQTAPCVIDVTGGSFGDVIARAQRGLLGAGVNAYYDVRQLGELVAAVSDGRGEQVDLSCVFNDRRRAGREATGPLPTPDDVRAALPLSTQRLDAKLDRPNRKLFVHLNDVRDTLDLVMRGDTHHLSPANLSACMRGMEAALVQEACDTPRRSASGAAATQR
jgi:non-ribosomal peptide synthetase component F